MEDVTAASYRFSDRCGVAHVAYYEFHFPLHVCDVFPLPAGQVVEHDDFKILGESPHQVASYEPAAAGH